MLAHCGFDADTLRYMVVDDEAVTVRRLVQVLEKDGCRVEGYSDVVKAMDRIRTVPPDILILDVHLQDVDGVDLMQQVHTLSPHTAVILITGYASIEHAVQATKQGAFHYLAKPFKLDELRGVIRQARESLQGRRQEILVQQALEKDSSFGEMIGKSAPMREIFNTISSISALDCNVMIQGESGTGKELVARSLHNHSRRKNKPFVSFNCGAFAEELVANELFGHEKGAFTGAVTTRIGLLESANGGTVFFDELTEMPLSMQVKLLRVIQERAFLRVGGVRSIGLDIRLIAATNRDIGKMIAAGSFRQDLYYRFKVVLIQLPPLRERSEDIPLLCRHFVKKTAKNFGRPVPTIAPEFIDTLASYPFPGNVRELEHIIEQAMALSKKDTLTRGDLPADLSFGTTARFVQPARDTTSLKSMEKDHIFEVYRQTGFNQTETAHVLGISRTTLWRRLKAFGLLEDQNPGQR